MSRQEWLENKRKANEGKRYGNVTVLKYSRTTDKTYYICRCELCGKEFETRLDGVKNGHTNSCGCASEKWMHSGKLNRKHGLYKDRAYWVWTKVKARCYNPNAREYPNYGGRGIKMCDDWLNADNFIKWAYEHGYDKDAPKGVCTLDRVDVDGDYEPSNCRFITNLKQQNNRRNNIFVEYNGKRGTIAEWSRELNIPYTTLLAGITKYGKPIEYYINSYIPRERK